jgi:hypothetical protein
MSQPSKNSQTSSTSTPFVNIIDRTRLIPERQVYSRNEKPEWELHGQRVIVTGGFMESFGHGWKNFYTAYIDSNNRNPNKPASKPPGNYNIGLDYVVLGKDKQVNPWYAGEVTAAGLNGGYGYSVTVKTNQSYVYDGVSYPIYTTYSHLEGIAKGIEVGKQVYPSTSLGKMGGTGTNGKKVYPEHVDLQTYIMVNGKKVQISQNLMQQNIQQQQAGANNKSSNSTENDSWQSSPELKAQYRVLLEAYSADKKFNGQFSIPSMVQSLQNAQADYQTIARVLHTHFELNGVPATEIPQKITESFAEATLPLNTTPVTTNQAASGMEK